MLSIFIVYEFICYLVKLCFLCVCGNKRLMYGLKPEPEKNYVLIFGGFTVEYSALVPMCVIISILF